MENRLCYLPDDLLVRILHFVPTKDAVATSILSKRWRPVWTMLPGLAFKDEGSESVGWFIEKSLQLHKAPKLLRLIVEFGPSCSVDVDVDVGKLVENAVNRGVKVLDFQLLWNADPTSFPKGLYTCDTLVDLTLSKEILVDVCYPARLPSLLNLNLHDVVYRDEDSLAKLLSSSPVLKWLSVRRRGDDNVKSFAVKVPSLETLIYATPWRTSEVKDDEVENEEVDDDEVENEEVEDDDEVEDNDEEEYEVEDDDEVEDNDEEEYEVEEDDDDLNGSLVIDSPALTGLYLLEEWGDYLLIENMPCLDVAEISLVDNPSCDNFLTSLSSAIHLHLSLTQSMVACCNAVKFSRLIEFYFCPETSVDWLEPLMFLLQSSPKLKSLTIHTNTGVLPPSWNQPSFIPGCLSSQLEIFGWRGYGGREDEKQLVTYILANSKCLKRVEISFIEACNLEERRKEIESMPRISTSSRLLFPAKMRMRFNGITSH